MPTRYFTQTLIVVYIIFYGACTATATFSAQQEEKQHDLSFIAIGDTPCSFEEEQRLKQEIADAVKAAAPPFPVFHGDLKGGVFAAETLLGHERPERCE